MHDVQENRDLLIIVLFVQLLLFSFYDDYHVHCIY